MIFSRWQSEEFFVCDLFFLGVVVFMVSGFVVDGVVSVLVSSGERCAGDYVVTGVYQRNDVYEGAVGSGVLTVLKHDTVLGVAGVTGYVGDTVSLAATVKDENNNNVGTGVVDWLVFPEHDITLDINDWEYGKLSGTSVSDANLINPSVSGGELSTGRGEVVYYVPRIPTDLTEWILYCKIHGSNLYNRIGISTITTVSGNLAFDEDSTWLLKDLISGHDNSTSHDLEFKFLDNVCYIYVDGLYTGFSKDCTNSSNLHLMGYSNCYYNNTNFPLTFEEVKYYDCVDLSTVPTVGGGGND